jgi:hypothetical protein
MKLVIEALYNTVGSKNSHWYSIRLTDKDFKEIIQKRLEKMEGTKVEFDRFRVTNIELND